jgi:ligand-binding SRPBCC domain-containing protein
VAKLELVTMILASAEVCFDRSRDLDLHVRSMRESGERAIAGRTTGLIGLDEEVLFEARHFGVKHRHHSRITQYDRPHHFRDEMLVGRFKRFEHDHFFESNDGGTKMRDVIEFDLPFGPIGRFVDWALLAGYLGRLIQSRNETIRLEAESRS